MTNWTHCPRCGRPVPTGVCAWCALGTRGALTALEWVTRCGRNIRCRTCGGSAAFEYRPLAASAAVKGKYCLDHLPLDDPGEVRRVVEWITRKAYG